MAAWNVFADMTPTNKRLWSTFQFLARFAVLALPLYLILELGISLYVLQLAVADHMYWLFTAWGFPIMQDGILFTLAGDSPFSFVISQDCIGWKSMLLLFALIVAVPKISNKRRALGLVIGIPLIWIGNLSRIFGIVWAQQTWGTETALFLHDILWQLGLSLLVIVIWSVWLFWRPQSHSKVSAKKGAI
jgi:exosortase/archaeosortase family protein